MCTCVRAMLLYVGVWLVVVLFFFFLFLMIRRPPRSTQSRSSAASDVYKRQVLDCKKNLKKFYVSTNMTRSCLVRKRKMINLKFVRRLSRSVDNKASVITIPRPIALAWERYSICLLYTSPSPRDRTRSRMPSSA